MEVKDGLRSEGPKPVTRVNERVLPKILYRDPPILSQLSYTNLNFIRKVLLFFLVVNYYQRRTQVISLVITVI